MAHTAIRDSRMKEEIVMSAEELDAQVTKVADLVRAAKAVCFFTGAGLSTSAGIADYRSIAGTITGTGGGVWELAAEGKQREVRTTPMHLAEPTLAHMGIVEFQNQGKLSCVISQNVDGLHRRSGIGIDEMCELHGDLNIEECRGCGKPHHRELAIHGDNAHFTGRVCCACAEPLRDSIINFGENLNPVVLEKAYSVSRSADLHICLGSSLSVSPACDLPKETKRNGGKVVICNLQRTPLDAEYCDVRIHSMIDVFFQSLFKKLGWSFPKYTIQKQVTVLRQQQQQQAVRFCATSPGTDIPSSSFGVIKMSVAEHKQQQLKDYTVDAAVLSDICPTFTVETGAEKKHAPEIQFACTGFYPDRREPKEALITLPKDCDAATYYLTYTVDPATESDINNNNKSKADRQWTVRTETENVVQPNFSKGRTPTRVSGIRDKTGQDYTGWFAVTPVADCPHTKDVKFAEGMVFDHTQPCCNETCKNVGENWMCLTCGLVACSRHVKGHMVEHYEQTRHSVCVSFADMSVWCNTCETYIDPENRKVKPLHHTLYQAKFGNIDPSSSHEMINSAEEAGAAKQPGASSAGSGDKKPKSSTSTQVSNDNAAKTTTTTTTVFDETPDDDGGKTGFAVQPLHDCPHTASCRFVEDCVFDIKTPCATCGVVGECMLCLGCGEVHCGRYVKKHMLTHHTKTGHPMVVAFTDLSCWCYECESYVSQANPKVQPFVKLLHMAKFGQDDGAFVSRSPATAAAAAAAVSAASNAPGGIHCSHIHDALASDPNVDINRMSHLLRGNGGKAMPCEKCSSTDTKVCLTCGKVFCGRYANSHMIDHADEEDHPCVAATEDETTKELSVWCYNCDNFVQDRQVKQALRSKGVLE